MKKIIVLLFCSVILCACSNNQQTESLTCSKDTNLNELLDIDAKWKIDVHFTHVNGIVTKAEFNEYIDFNNQDDLETVKEFFVEESLVYEDLKHFDINIESSNNRLITKTIVDYTKIDVEKLKNKQSFIIFLLDDDNNLLLENARKWYTNQRFTCLADD